VLVYQDTRAAGRTTPPPWLDGAADLHARESLDHSQRWWGIGNAHLVGPRDGGEALDDGWHVSIAGRINPQEFRRVMRWCRTTEARDTAGRAWAAPVILSTGGDRTILVAYGKDFLPALTPAQDRAVSIARAAREALETAHEVDGAGLDMSLAARWTAELLALTHHVDMGTLAALQLVDEALILAVLSAATGLPLKKSEA